ncbi:MAG: hypothetical protein ACLFUU_05430 [Desulfobacteraceae bacterium]
MFMPVKVSDVTLRDGIEDFVLKYIHIEELVRLGELLDRAGFYSIDCWGGTTFYAALTALKEDPWERLKKLRRAVHHTPLQMIVRGQMLVGFKPYHKELVRKFMSKAAALGIDIFRIYDSLNDLQNMKLTITVAKELRKQVEATLLFSLNPHIKTDDYIRLAGELIHLGADAICINDSFGVMTPHQVASLVASYRKYFSQPLRLHLHDNHQTALTSYQEGIRSGAEMVDTILSALAWPYGPPAVESLVFSLGGTLYDPHLDVDVLSEISEYIRSLKKSYNYQEPVLKRSVDHLAGGYLPGPLKEFIREELIRRKARDRQQLAFKEGKKVWEDLGFPPLKGRILEIVGEQTVENIFSRHRYETITPGMRDLVQGRYGRLYTPANDALRRRAMAAAEAEAGPGWEGTLRHLPGLTREEDVLTYSLFPEEASGFFRLKLQAPTEKAPSPAAAAPAAPAPEAPVRLPPAIPRGLSMILKGEEVTARMEGIGPLRNNKQTLFVSVFDHTEEIEVHRPASADRMPEYVVTMHGETYRIKFKKAFPKEEEYVPIFLEVNGKIEEFLIKHIHID